MRDSKCYAEERSDGGILDVFGEKMSQSARQSKIAARGQVVFKLVSQ